MRWRRALVVFGALIAVAAFGAAMFGPVVRWRVAREAAKRRVCIDVGGVRPGWFAVRLRDVRVRPQGVSGVEARIAEIRVELGVSLRPRDVIVHGGEISLEGELAELASSLRAWRGAAHGDAAGGAQLPWRAEDLAAKWAPGPAEAAALEASGIAVERGDFGYRAGVEAAKWKRDGASVELGGAKVELDAAGALRRVRATRALIGYDVGLAADSAGSAAPVSPLDPAPPPLPILVASKGRHPGAAVPVPPAAAPDVPLLALPDLHAARAKARTLAGLLAARMPEGSSVSIEKLELQLGVRGDHIALGPGSLAIERTPEQVHLSFSTGDAEPTAAGSTRLSLEGNLPLGDGDVTVQLAGGPVALSLLGVRSGAMGLTDVERATLAGKARVVVSDAGDAVTFDVNVKVRGLAIENARLATEVVRGLDFGVDARGVLDDKGEVRLDDAQLEMGALHLLLKGGLQQAEDHVAASLTFDVPIAPCQRLLDSVPSALIPTVRGARMAGTFGARGRLAFDTRKLDDLVLDYTIADECSMTEVPEELSRDRFTKPFTHRVYLSDGKMADEITGPGTPEWTDLDHISPYMQVAVLTTEDGAFPHHHGFAHGAIRNALVANLKARKFLRGASTITMQLAKNLFLTRDKTLSRKLEEVILTDYLEQIFRKDDMMELYLNIIEFGPDIYGVTRAAQHYFGRKPEELNLAECLFLSSIMPSPLRNHKIYEKGEIPEAWMRHVRQLMEIAERTGKISKAELAEGLTEPIVFHHEDAPPPAPRAPLGPIHITGADEAEWQQLN